jgi:hypothetical protein
VTTILDLRAVRPGRLAMALADGPLLEEGRPLRPYLRGARVEELPGGVRLEVELGVADIAALAELLRGVADSWPFLSFHLAADPPWCRLEVRGQGPAEAIARAVFSELGTA